MSCVTPNQKLEQARADVETDIQNLLASASSMAERGKISLVDALLERQATLSHSVSDVNSLPETGRTVSNSQPQSPALSPISTREARQLSTESSVEHIQSATLLDADIPVYLRGGTATEGLGSLLRNALALLYTARLGLKEAELWSILARLKANERTLDAAQQRLVSQEEALLNKLYPIRGELIDRLR